MGQTMGAGGVFRVPKNGGLKKGGIFRGEKKFFRGERFFFRGEKNFFRGEKFEGAC